MKNYEAVAQWAATVNLDKAIDELTNFRAKYPWARLDETQRMLLKISTDMPRIISIIKHQEKQNAIHREFIRVSRAADDAITTSIIEKYNIDLNG